MIPVMYGVVDILVLFITYSVSDKNFEGVPIVIIKQETRENCRCPCKDKQKDSDSSSSSAGGASMILLDSTTLPQKTFNNSNLRNVPPNVSLAYQPQASQVNFPSVEQNMISPMMAQPSLEITVPDPSNLPASNLNYTYPQDYQFDISSNAPSVTSSGLPYGSVIGGLGTTIDPMEPLFTSLTPATDVTTPTTCCDNESILQCVTLGCNSHKLAPKP